MCRDVANKMGLAAEDQLLAGVAGGSSTAALSESHAEIVKSCEEECRLYNDPTVMEQLQLQMAVEAERYEEASQCAASFCCLPRALLTKQDQTELKAVVKPSLQRTACCVTCQIQKGTVHANTSIGTWMLAAFVIGFVRLRTVFLSCVLA